MEIYSNSTRFALACNTSSKIIKSIQSRCALIRFSKLSDQEILGRIMVLVDAVKVPYIREGLEAIIFTTDGDMKQVLDNLPAIFGGFCFVNQENTFKQLYVLSYSPTVFDTIGTHSYCPNDH